MGGFDAKSKLVNQLIDIVDFGNIAATCVVLLRYCAYWATGLLPTNNL